jgi:hypothetical protein
MISLTGFQRGMASLKPGQEDWTLWDTKLR